VSAGEKAARIEELRLQVLLVADEAENLLADEGFLLERSRAYWIEWLRDLCGVGQRGLFSMRDTVQALLDGQDGGGDAAA